MSRQRVLTAEEHARIKTLLEDPTQYSERFMNADLWEAQRFILTAIKTAYRVAIKACHSSGKTFAAALAVLWWITRYKDGIAVTTAPTWLQVEKLIWGEIHRAIQHSRVAYPKPNITELELGPQNYAIGISTNEAGRFQGFHQKHVLVVMDEAQGVRNVIWEAVEGIRAGGHVCELALGNPVISSGPFHEAHTTQRSSWVLRTISAFDTPNLRSLIPEEPSTLSDERLMAYLDALTNDELDNNVRPYLTTRRWVKEKWDEWGKHGNPLWDARVMGRFARQATDALFPLSMLEEAANREVNKSIRHRPHIGIDVAGPGEDETVMTVTEGPNILEQHWWNDPDPRGKVLKTLKTWKIRDPVVNVDSVGMGYYFAAHIEDAGYTVGRINVSTAANDPERFVNLKSQLHWALRERLEEGSLNGLTDETTISQLASIKYTHDSRGRVVVESKPDMRKRGVKSPDRAESLMLAYAPAELHAVALV